MSITVSIVDDDAALRSGWVRIINRAPGYRCNAEYGTAEAAIAGIPDDAPNVVLVDINLPGLSGIDCVRELKPKLPEVDFIMLTIFSDQERIFDALRAGAVGYLLKSDPSKALINAIAQVRAGGAAMSSKVARQVMRFFHASEEESKRANSALSILHDREREVLKLLAAGKHYKEIASALYISVDTVRFHIRHIYEKLQVHSRTEAAAKFFGH
jgi:RNA polymerase sigma factor (sigma-70 family)